MQTISAGRRGMDDRPHWRGKRPKGWNKAQAPGTGTHTTLRKAGLVPGAAAAEPPPPPTSLLPWWTAWKSKARRAQGPGLESDSGQTAAPAAPRPPQPAPVRREGSRGWTTGLQGPPRIPPPPRRRPRPQAASPAPPLGGAAAPAGGAPALRPPQRNRCPPPARPPARPGPARTVAADTVARRTPPGHVPVRCGAYRAGDRTGPDRAGAPRSPRRPVPSRPTPARSPPPFLRRRAGGPSQRPNAQAPLLEAHHVGRRGRGALAHAQRERRGTLSLP